MPHSALTTLLPSSWISIRPRRDIAPSAAMAHLQSFGLTDRQSFGRLGALMYPYMLDTCVGVLRDRRRSLVRGHFDNYGLSCSGQGRRVVLGRAPPLLVTFGTNGNAVSPRLLSWL